MKTESPDDNVWNSASPGLVEDGIDDTFEVHHPTIRPGDTSAQVDYLLEPTHGTWCISFSPLTVKSPAGAPLATW